MRRGFVLGVVLTGVLAGMAATGTAAAAGARAESGADPRTILFIGNSFTEGSHSAVLRYNADKVRDLNKRGLAGMPALFATFAEQKGLKWKVSLETQGGQTLGFHYEKFRKLIDKRWDAVVLQEYSTLDPKRPGDTTGYRRYAPLLADMFLGRNRDAQVWLMPTWTRADQAWQANGHWFGKPVERMADDLYAAAVEVCTTRPVFAGLLPVGKAWNRAFAAGVADPNPYDGLTFGQVNLWGWDHYHASMYGSYLEALVVFGRVTGVDPRSLGREEQAARDLGIGPKATEDLQRIAGEEIAQPDPCRAA